MCFDIFIKRLERTPPEKLVCHGWTCWPLTCKISQSAMISQWHFKPHSLVVWFLCRQRQALVTGIASLLSLNSSVPQNEINKASFFGRKNYTIVLNVNKDTMWVQLVNVLMYRFPVQVQSQRSEPKLSWFIPEWHLPHLLQHISLSHRETATVKITIAIFDILNIFQAPLPFFFPKEFWT